jgi:hypothetical protein
MILNTRRNVVFRIMHAPFYAPLCAGSIAAAT